MAGLSSLRCRHAGLIFACRLVRERWGEAAVDKLVACHMAAIRRDYAERARRLGRNDLATFVEQMAPNPQTHTRQVVRSDARVYEMKITRCAHAEIFAEYEAGDLGEKFVCNGDLAMLEGFNPAIRLRRPTLLMRGEDCCHFLYTMEG